MLQTAKGRLHPTDLIATFFTAALVMIGTGLVMIAAAVSGVAGAKAGWAALHLIFLGGISQLILGAAQFFCTAFLATDPPPRRIVHMQVGAWNLGAAATVAGVALDLTPLFGFGGLLLLAGLGLFARALINLQRGSLQQAIWAVRWYQAGAACLAIGIVIGLLIAGNVGWPHGNLAGAHMTLNLAGWVGTAIVGTLHTFFPSLTQAALPRPRLQMPTFHSWLGGTLVLAGGYAFGSKPLILIGWLSLTAAALMLAVNLIGCLRASPVQLSPAARLIAAGQSFLPIGLLAALITAVTASPFDTLGPASRTRMTLLLLIGWIGLTVLGSLIHLLGVLRHVRRLRRRFAAGTRKPPATPGASN